MNSWSRLTVAALFLAIAPRGAEVDAQSIQWNVASGNYGNSASWQPATVPTDSDDAEIGNGGTAMIDGVAGARQLRIGSTSGSGTVQVTTDSELVLGDRLFVGFTGSGLVEQTGGVVRVEQGDGDLHIGDSLGSQGTYDFIDGEISVGDDILVGHLGTGQFNMSGGVVLRSGWFVLGDEDPEQTGGDPATGTFNFSGGEFNQEFGDFEIGDEGIGVANLTGGVMNIAGVTAIGNRPLGFGTLNISGPVELRTKEFSIGRRGQGILHVSSSGARIVVSEQFTMQAEPDAVATWIVEIGPTGTAPIEVGFGALLAGTLDVELASGFSPNTGQSFALLTAADDIVDDGLTLAAGDQTDWRIAIAGNMLQVEFIGSGQGALQPGDANMDLKFDQLDIIRVQQAAKYLTGQQATWGEGDWNGAPGGAPGNPPPGDGLFNQTDIIGALSAGKYLTGPYAALGPSGRPGDGQTSIGYDPSTGEVFVDAPAGTDLTSINIDSAGGIFTGQPAQNLGGSFDNDADNNIFKATFGSSFGSLSFGNVAATGLSQEFVLGDLTVVGSLAGGGGLGNVDLIYVPEPSGVVLLGVALFIAATGRRCCVASRMRVGPRRQMSPRSCAAGKRTTKNALIRASRPLGGQR
jgi:hypothetical protein